MSFLAEAVRPRLQASSYSDWSVMDDRWYTSDLSGFIAAAGGGVAVDADTMLRCSTVLAAVRFRGDSWAMCQPSTYRKTERGRVEEPRHYSQMVLRRPNNWQTGNRWRHLMGVWMATWGNAYSRILSERTYADELRPVHPSTIKPVRQRPDGSLLYEIRPKGEPLVTVGGEEILHFRDISTDGFVGLPMYQLIRNVVSIALLAEQHEATFLRKGTRISGLLTTTSPLTQDQRKLLKDSVNDDMGPAGVTGGLGILPFGVDIKPLTLGARVEQRAELSDQNVAAILRFLGVPGVVVGFADKTATYASAKEFFESGGIKHCVLPILVNAEAEEEKSLLAQDSGLFIRHNLDVLLRSNTKDRYEAYKAALGSAPWMTRNEVRETEDLGALDDPGMDEVQVPANMLGAEPDAPEPGPGGEPARPTPPAAPPTDDGGQSDDAKRLAAGNRPPVLPAFANEPAPEPEPEADEVPGPLPVAPVTVFESRARLYARDNAGRVLRREVEIVQKGGKHAGRSWPTFVLASYEKHAGYVAETMRVSPEQARAYCDAQAAALIAGGAGVAEGWESAVPEKLVALALGEVA